MSLEKPLKIVSYKVVRVDHSWSGLVSRYALSNLTSGQGVEDDSAAIIEATRTMVLRRRSALRRLRAAGWEPVLDWLNYVYAMNCPPVGVFINTRGLQPCSRARFCPFCWCRQCVIGPLAKFHELLCDDLEPEKPTTKRELLEVDYWQAYPRTGSDLGQILAESRLLRKSLIDQLRLCSIGAYAVSSVTYTAHRWLSHCRALVVVPNRELELPPEIHAADQFLQYRRRDLTGGWNQLAASLGRTASYPTSMINGKAESTLELLSAMPTHFRMREYYGQLRSTYSGYLAEMDI